MEEVFHSLAYWEKGTAVSRPILERRVANVWVPRNMDDRPGLIVCGRVKILKEKSNPNNPLIVGLFGLGAFRP